MSRDDAKAALSAGEEVFEDDELSELWLAERFDETPPSLWMTRQ